MSTPTTQHQPPYPNGEDPRPWWFKQHEERVDGRLAGIERIQRVQTAAFIVGAPAIAAAGYLAGQFKPGVAALATSWLADVAAILVGWAI